jgi:epoxyqueuosine reductase
MDACPTEAIISPAIVNGSKCISYLTIELKDALMPEGLEDKMQGWMFGCDICQDVCPWNRFSKPNHEKHFKPIPEVLNLSLSEWENLGEEAFKKIFKDSPIKRSKWQGVLRNIQAVKESS